MRGLWSMVGLLAAVGAAALLVLSLGGASASAGLVVLGLLGLLAVWPLGCFVWAAVLLVRFARARGRAAARLAQEIDRCGRAGERIVLVMLRFPDFRTLDFPFFPSRRGALDMLRAHFRSYDQIERVDFNMYVMILPGTDSLGVIAVRDRLLEAVRREHRWRIRVGLSVHPEDGLTPDILLDHASRHCA